MILEYVDNHKLINKIIKNYLLIWI